MRIGIIGPCEDEIIPFIAKIENPSLTRRAMLDLYSGTYSNIL